MSFRKSLLILLAVLFFMPELQGIKFPWKTGDVLAFRLADGSYLTRYGDLAHFIQPSGNGNILNSSTHFKVDQVGSGTTPSMQNLGVTEDLFCLLAAPSGDRLAVEQDAAAKRVLSFKPTTNSKGWLSLVEYDPVTRIASLDAGTNARVQRVKSLEEKKTAFMYGVQVDAAYNNLVCRQVNWMNQPASPADFRVEIIPVEEKHKVFYQGVVYSNASAASHTAASIPKDLKTFSDAFDVQPKTIDDWFYVTRFFASWVDSARRSTALWDAAVIDGISALEYAKKLFLRALTDLARLRTTTLTTDQKISLLSCEESCGYYLTTLVEKVAGYRVVSLPATGTANYYIKVNRSYLDFGGTVEIPSWSLSDTPSRGYFTLKSESATSFSAKWFTGSENFPLRFVPRARLRSAGTLQNEDQLRLGKPGTSQDIFSYKALNIFTSAPTFYALKSCATSADGVAPLIVCVSKTPKVSPLFKFIGPDEVPPAGYEYAIFSFEPVSTTKVAFLSIPSLESSIHTAQTNFVLDEMLRVASSKNPSEADSLKFALSGQVLSKRFNVLTSEQQTKFLSLVLA